MYDCEAATVLLNVYICLVFVGEGWLALLPSYLPHLRQLCLVVCDNLCDTYLEELVAAVPELNLSGKWVTTVGAIRKKSTKSSKSTRRQNGEI